MPLTSPVVVFGATEVGRPKDHARWLVQRLAVRFHAGLSSESRFCFYLERAHHPSPQPLPEQSLRFRLVRRLL